jgi:hypothetical protein
MEKWRLVLPHPLMCLECLQVLADAYLKATEVLLLISADFEAETVTRSIVGIYRLAKDEGGEQG